MALYRDAAASLHKVLYHISVELKDVTIVQLHLRCYIFVYLSKLKIEGSYFSKRYQSFKDDRSRLSGMETVMHATWITGTRPIVFGNSRLHLQSVGSSITMQALF